MINNSFINRSPRKERMFGTSFYPLIKQIIRILFVLNPSPQLFIIGFYVVVFLHHEEVIRLYQASYIREFFRMLANGTDRKLNDPSVGTKVLY